MEACLTIKCENHAARKLCHAPLCQHDLSNGPVGKHFIKRLTDEFDGVLIRKLDVENPYFLWQACFRLHLTLRMPQTSGSELNNDC